MNARPAALVLFLAFVAGSYAGVVDAAERWRDSLPQSKIYGNFNFYFLAKDELNLTDDQFEALQQEFKNHLARSRKEIDQMAREGVGTKGEDAKRRLAADRRLQVEASDSFFAVLDEQQQKRAVELSLQLEGAFAFREKRLASELALSDEQRDKVEAIIDEYRAKMDASDKEFRDDRKRKNEESRRLHKERHKAVVAVLNDEQLTKYKFLQGAPSKASKSEE